MEAACLAADELAEAVEASSLQHPDAEVILSFPGLGVQLGARVLAEIGDDRQRFADAHYRRRREQGDWHAAARRHLFNRLIGQLHHCLQTGELFDEHVAFPSELAAAA